MRSLKTPVFSVTQPIGTFYVASMRAVDLLEICKFDYRRMTYVGGYVDFLGIQRRIDDRRVREIVSYIRTLDSCFPTSVVISIDEKCASIYDTDVTGVHLLAVKEYVDSEDPSLSIPYEQIASIIDGQHRLKGLEESGQIEFDIGVAIFVGVDDATEATIFSTVNLAQTKVNRSLVYDLFSLAKTPSPEKTCHEIAVALDRLEESPLHNKIKRLGTATEGRFGETLSQATVVKSILPYITNDPVGDRDRGRRFEHWVPIDTKGARNRIFYQFFANKEDQKILAILMNYFSAIRDRWSGAWANTGQGNIINRTNGFNGFMRFLRPAYLYFTTEPTVVRQDDFAKLFEKTNLRDEDFNPNMFPPGTSGSSKLYRLLVEQTGVTGN